MSDSLVKYPLVVVTFTASQLQVPSLTVVVETEKVSLQSESTTVQLAIEDLENSFAVVKDTVLYQQTAPCSVDGDCGYSDSRCVDGTYRCFLGVPYNPRENRCVVFCDEYGSEFDVMLGHYVSGHNHRWFYNLTPEQCRDKCTMETGFTCRSADYRPSDGKCNLSYSTLFSVDKNEYVEITDPNATYLDHFARLCKPLSSGSTPTLKNLLGLDLRPVYV